MTFPRALVVYFIAIACVFVGSVRAEDAIPQRILFIGNSYTGGTKSGIEFFLKQANPDIQLQFIHPGGRRLSNHAENEQTLKSIAEGKWDLVVLQEQSQLPSLPGFRDEYLRAGVLLSQSVRKANSNCLLFETWGRREGDKQNPKLNPDFAAMQKRLTEGYTALGERTATPIAPVGQAWAIVHDESPELFAKLYARDGSHPSPLGAYLTGAVFYAAITGKDPVEVKALPRGIGEDDATSLRTAAKKAVK